MTYVYGVARDAAGLTEFMTSLKGVANAPVQLLADPRNAADLVLVTSHVPAHDFQEDALKRHLEDLDWLEEVARAHHGVIEALTTRTTVLPLRLATVYLDDTRARDVLEGGRALFSERLARLDEHVEWGVKIYVEASTTSAAPSPAARDDLTPGRAYLRNRRHQQSTRDSAYQAAQQAAARVEAAGRKYATDWARHRVQQGALAGGAGENVVNDAYLVPRDRCQEFRDVATRSADGLRGVRVEVTGPWAPYSFATPPDESGGTAESVPQ
ncbi:GvpL/GvpF family gas vesicle protein [Streptomyces sp. NPDC058287]|uniref:GvpL/GvpF family gas vesicle protein n=1 Tax=unclassified Streptomyces TaxID=2593676 RepID=UPI0036EE7472